MNNVSDKEYKKFYKKLDWDDEELINYLKDYSEFLDNYL